MNTPKAKPRGRSPLRAAGAERAAAAAAPVTADTVLQALRLVLEPLLRLAIASQVTQPAVAELVKRVFVDVAGRDFALDGERPTDSRIHLLTGLHRKDIRRLRALPAQGGVVSTRATLAGAVIASWGDEPSLCNARGRPLPLPVCSRTPGEASFEGLVRAASTDIGYRPLMDEWLRLGVLKRRRDGRLELDVSAVHRGMPADAAVDLLGILLQHHAEALLDALAPEPGDSFSLHMTEQGLTPQSVAELQALARQRAARLVTEMNAQALRRRQRDRGRADAVRAFHLGLFGRAPQPQPQPAAAAAADEPKAPARTRRPARPLKAR
jgi:hypothetical protein